MVPSFCYDTEFKIEQSALLNAGTCGCICVSKYVLAYIRMHAHTWLVGDFVFFNLVGCLLGWFVAGLFVWVPASSIMYFTNMGPFRYSASHLYACLNLHARVDVSVGVCGRSNVNVTTFIVTLMRVL
jgi:hypothetical protein